MDSKESLIKAVERSIKDLEEIKNRMIEEKAPIMAIWNLDQKIKELNKMKEDGKWLVRF